ncbi:MAG: hypothetical protein AVDCRST_MAG14-2321, partial [uncultured Rubrobacteraceae bacterium]
GTDSPAFGSGIVAHARRASRLGLRHLCPYMGRPGTTRRLGSHPRTRYSRHSRAKDARGRGGSPRSRHHCLIILFLYL